MSNREINFRAWVKEEKRMVGVTSLSIPTHNLVFTENGDEAPKSYLGDQVEVMQYTGVKDKNRKEIYDGDIMNLSQWSPSVYMIAFDRGAFYLAKKDGEEVGDIKYAEGGEVIGNIYENPDLLPQP